MGRVGQEPELKDVGQSQVLNFSIANETGFGDNKTTNWFRCAIWGKQATSLQQYISKGKQLFVTGELTLRKYEKDGVEKMSPEIRVNSIDFVGGRGDGEQSASSAPAQAPAPSSPETSEDMPF